MRGARFALLLVAGLFTMTPGVARVDRQEQELAWPADRPRVEFVQEVTRASGRGRWLRRLSGRAEEELFRRPYGVAWDGDDLLVTDPGAGGVVRIDRRGRAVRTPDGLFASPIGVAACRPGIVVTDSRLGRVALLDRQLRLERWLAEDLDRPTGIACREDRLFVVETSRHRVLVLETLSAGAASARAERVLGGRGEDPGAFNFPTAAAVGSQLLWVADTLNFRVQGIDPVSGDPRAVFGTLGDMAGEMPRIKAVAVDADDRLWVSDAHLDQVALYDLNGGFLMALGGRGVAPGEFSFPAGIAAHRDGRVAVVDSLNRRLQIFRLLPADPGEAPENE